MCTELSIDSANELIESGSFSCLNLLGDQCRVSDPQPSSSSAADNMVSDNAQYRHHPQKNIIHFSPPVR